VATTEPRRDEIDNPLERLELLAGDEAAIAGFLDTLETRGPREREMLAELARGSQVARLDLFWEAHRRMLSALESLGRHGYQGAQPPGWLRFLKMPARYAIELVARYVVVSYLRRISTELRNLYWLREMQATANTDERYLLRAARRQAENLEVVFARREIGLPSFVLGAFLIPLIATTIRLGEGIASDSWIVALTTGVGGAIVFVLLSWVILRGAAMASRRIGLSARGPLQALWDTVGHAGRPPSDDSRKFALIAIALTAAGWIVIPLAVLFAVW
jgi:hypothetical protein